jgi:type VI protein secretion system component VasF
MSHANHPPELPEVTDEAGDTPSWVPLLGVVLFALTVAYIWWAHRQHDALVEGTGVGAAEAAP